MILVVKFCFQFHESCFYYYYYSIFIFLYILVFRIGILVLCLLANCLITYLSRHFIYDYWDLWNQGLVNLGFDDNKTRFRTNDYILSVIRQEDFQSGNHKDKSSQREIIKKKKTSKRSIFQDPSFIRSLCKVVGALEFSCIALFTYAPKSSKSYFVLNILKLDDFMFSTKTLCKMFSKLV